MTDSKAVYAAFASVIAALLVSTLTSSVALPEDVLKAIEGQQYNLRLLIEMSIHATVQAIAAYWGAWWAPPNAPEIPQ